jgi:hypothetical protein
MFVAIVKMSLSQAFDTPVVKVHMQDDIILTES